MEANVKIIEKNRADIAAVLAAVQDGHKARLVSVDDVYSLAEKAERALEKLGLPLRERAGARYAFSEGGVKTRARSYGSRPSKSTRVIIERNSSGWRLVDAVRGSYHPNQKGDDHLLLTEAQKSGAVERFARTIETDVVSSWYLAAR